MKLEIFTDGGCSGHPGEAAIGVVIKDGTKTVKTFARAIGKVFHGFLICICR